MNHVCIRSFFGGAVALLLFFSAGVGFAQLFEVKPAVVEKIEKALPKSSPAKPKKPRKVLVFSKTSGFRHGSIPVGAKSIVMLGEKTGAFEAVHSEDDSMFEPESLNQFDAVIMLNTTGKLFLPKPMPKDPAEKAKALEREKRLKKSLVDFVKGGKGLAGTHSATDTYKNWKEYNDMMGGAFDGHPWHEPVPVRLLDASHPLNKVFKGEGFTITDEIYQFREDTAKPSDRRLLLTLDPGFKKLNKGKRKDRNYPISWIDKYGEGRIFYCSLGHRDEIYYNPVILEHYLAGFQYAIGDLDADATPLSTSDEAVDISGEWDVSAETGQGDMESIWEFKKTDDGISGATISDGARKPLANLNLSGKELQFDMNVELQGMSITIEVKAEFESDKAAGSWVAFNDAGEELANGTLSATKSK
ncbi:MAG: ThuA domain-containing protein [Mariniblastus sp.]|nr:ThuA domain-containing protein [Mariniblastus sp.]